MKNKQTCDIQGYIELSSVIQTGDILVAISCFKNFASQRCLDVEIVDKKNRHALALAFDGYSIPDIFAMLSEADLLGEYVYFDKRNKGLDKAIFVVDEDDLRKIMASHVEEAIDELRVNDEVERWRDIEK